MFTIEHPQNLLVDRGFQPERTGSAKLDVYAGCPLMPAAQANAVTPPLDQLPGAQEIKPAQRGAVSTLLAGHQNGMERRHKPVEGQVLAHLHALLRHDRQLYKSPARCP